MILISDGEVIRNEVRRVGTSETPLPLGQDQYTGQIFGNRDFLLNCINYLVDDIGLLNLRSREMKLRLLDKTKIKNERIKWQVINLACPLVLVILAGILYNFLRKRVYT